MNGVALSVAIFGGCALIVAAFAGIMSIFLGWQLYRDAVFSKSTAEIANKPWPVRLAAGFAGVFLAIFGMGFLVYLTYIQANIADKLIVIWRIKNCS